MEMRAASASLAYTWAALLLLSLQLLLLYFCAWVLEQLSDAAFNIPILADSAVTDQIFD
jgi:hypothetical protein